MVQSFPKIGIVTILTIHIQFTFLTMVVLFWISYHKSLIILLIASLLSPGWFRMIFKRSVSFCSHENVRKKPWERLMLLSPSCWERFTSHISHLPLIYLPFTPSLSLSIPTLPWVHEDTLWRYEKDWFSIWEILINNAVCESSHFCLHTSFPFPMSLLFHLRFYPSIYPTRIPSVESLSEDAATWLSDLNLMDQWGSGCTKSVVFEMYTSVASSTLVQWGAMKDDTPLLMGRCHLKDMTSSGEVESWRP